MYLTIDVGGTKTLLAVFDQNGQIKKRQKFPTPVGYVEFISKLKATIKEICNPSELKSCAVAMPGTINRDSGVVESFGNLNWSNVPVIEDLKNILNCQILLENDAKLASLAEANELKDSFDRVLYLTVSTGIGISLVVKGKIDYSVHDAGGKGLMMEHEGRLMSWEDFASGKAIVRQTGKMASEITDDKDWYLVARNIAIGLIDLVVLLSPDCVVIGGGVGSHLDKFKNRLDEQLEIYKVKMLNKLPAIRQAQHPEEAVVYGGYLLCKQLED